jgi:hypothetical protein
MKDRFFSSFRCKKVRNNHKKRSRGSNRTDGAIQKISVNPFQNINNKTTAMLRCTQIRSMFSLFSKGFVNEIKSGKNHRFTVNDSDVVFEMRTRLSVRSDNCPLIVERFHFFRSHVDHRFDGNR